MATEQIMTCDEWRAEAIRRFGDDEMQWKFECPSCGHVASIQDYKNAGASSSHVAFSCIGRFVGGREAFGAKDGGPCNYAGGGLIGINPVAVDNGHGQTVRLFAFAETEKGRNDG